MRNKTIFAAIFCSLAFVINSQAQTETRCAINDADCLKAAAETTKTESAAVKADTRFKPARFVADAGSFAVMTPTPVPPAKSAADSGQQQVSPEEEAQMLAKKLANPVASLISLPFQNNFDFGMGPNRDGFKYTLNIQPVIPIALNPKWNLISRTILPVVYQTKVVGTTSQFGLSDTVQTFFFSPNKSKPFIWGLGPQFLIPTGTNNYIRSQKFGMGPSLLVMQQQGHWSYGILATQMWSVAGKSTRASVNSTFLQPFISYTTKTAWTYNLNTESTYDWTHDAWSVPVHFTVTKLVKLGTQRVSVGGAIRCWATSPTNGPRNCGFRLLFTPLFPKK